MRRLPAMRLPLARLLDDHVTFINEGGESATKKDIVGSAGPLPKGIENHLVQTDFHVQLYGTVAVTSFTDVQTELAHGQTFRAKYRSIEVWLKEGADWRMISSQTIALADDPPAVGPLRQGARRLCRHLFGRSGFHVQNCAQRQRTSRARWEAIRRLR
jgi:hypothetical protein